MTPIEQKIERPLDRFHALYREGRNNSKAPIGYIEYFKAGKLLLDEIDLAHQQGREDILTKLKQIECPVPNHESWCDTLEGGVFIGGRCNCDQSDLYNLEQDISTLINLSSQPPVDPFAGDFCRNPSCDGKDIEPFQDGHIHMGHIHFQPSVEKGQEDKTEK